jgi:hypothetical protein
VQDFLSMKWDCHSPSGGILVNHVASTLARKRESSFSNTAVICRAVTRGSFGIRLKLRPLKDSPIFLPRALRGPLGDLQGAIG